MYRVEVADQTSSWYDTPLILDPYPGSGWFDRLCGFPVQVPQAQGLGALYRERRYDAYDLQPPAAARTAGSEATLQTSAIDSLGWLSMAANNLNSLGASDSARKLGIVMPKSFIGAGQWKQRKEDLMVLEQSGLVCGRCEFPLRRVLLREAMAVTLDGWGDTIRLLHYSAAEHKNAVLSHAKDELEARERQAQQFARFEFPEAAEWAAGKYARTTREITVGSIARTGASEDDLALSEGAVVSLETGHPNKWWRGTTVGTRHAQVRKTPSWPRSWANFSLLWLYPHRNAWANFHMLGPPDTFLARQSGIFPASSMQVCFEGSDSL
jgi:hypothetical protein